MNNFPSRRERKALAKQFGLVKKKETLKEWYARTSRSIELGKQIHLYHLQQQENNRLNPDQKEEDPFSEIFTQTLGETTEETTEEKLEETPEASTEAAVTVAEENTKPIGGENQD
jgi:hypothetical protein